MRKMRLFGVAFFLFVGAENGIDEADVVVSYRMAYDTI